MRKGKREKLKERKDKVERGEGVPQPHAGQ